MTVEEKLRSIQESLANNPLYYASLTSRELFHSNMWYWFSRLNREETGKLFCPSLSPLFEYDFWREKQFKTKEGGKERKAIVDLTISRENSPMVVIECKVKDYPKDDQLQRIQKAVNSESATHVLVTLSPYETNIDGWEVISFKELHNRLEPGQFSEDNFEVTLVRNYKELLANLVEIEALLPNTNTYDFAISHNKDIFAVLNEIKLWALYQKKRASHFLSYARNQTGCDIEEYSINNQKATISFKVRVADDTLLGIQIEDKEYRKFVEGANAQMEANKLLGIYFDKDFRTKPTEKGLLFRSYNDNFRHQFEEIPHNISYQKLVDRIKADIEVIHRIKSSVSSR
jgi:hypothetical protein